jgi:biotin transport system substrate-specific component
MTDGGILRTAVLPRGGVLSRVVAIAFGAGLVAAAAQVSIPLPFTPVPITGQTFAVLLVGSSLGPIDGAASLGLYLLAGIAGAPVYADGANGWDVVSGATGGYLVGFIAAAALTGGLAKFSWDRRFASSVASMLSGNVVIYLFGLSWLAIKLHTGLEKTLELGLYPFVVGDLLKLYLAAALLPTAWRLVQAPGRRV